MLNITKLLSDKKTSHTVERRQRGEVSASPLTYRYSATKKPVVVWNVTYRCNLLCRHCYAGSMDHEYPGELTFKEGLSLIDDMGRFGVPVIIFSGGEPVLRDHLYHFASYAVKSGIMAALSSNGTLISKDVANKLKGSGFYYVGVSIDGDRKTNDYFRGKKGAFDEALRGLRECLKVGLKVGLRLTLTEETVNCLPYIFDLAEKEGVHRLYLSHLVYVGRGRRLSEVALKPERTRQVVDYIIKMSRDFLKRGVDLEVVTGNNDVDGIYLYYNELKNDHGRAEKIYNLLKRRGGNTSGITLACIDSFGNLHPDQYWKHYTIGNVREMPFSTLWGGDSEPLLNALRNRRLYLKGRCKGCVHLDVCGGNYRVRAEAFSGNMWEEDPACYLTDEEIGIKEREDNAVGI